MKPYVPAVVGVPIMAPDCDRLRPLGSDPPERDHLYGGVPPDADICWLKATLVAALGSAEVVISSAAVTLMLQLLAAVLAFESDAFSVMLADPACEGVPEKPPLEASSAMPDGRVPETDHVKGGVPPEALADELYGCPTVAEPAGQDAMTSPAMMVIEKFAEAVMDALSVTLRVKANDPGDAGVPDICPPASERPPGRAPDATDQL